MLAFVVRNRPFRPDTSVRNNAAVDPRQTPLPRSYFEGGIE
jgi:hypothetical protein